MRSNASLKMNGGGGHHKRKSMPDFKTMNNNDTTGIMSSGSIDAAKGFYQT